MYRFKWFLCMLLAGLCVVPAAAQNNPRSHIKTIESYIVYYGTGRADDLSRFDLAIVQPETLTAAELAARNTAGQLTVAYLSIGEAGFRHAVKGPDGSVEVSVHTDSAEQVVILDGSAVRLGKGDERRKAAELYGEKYGSQYGDVTNFRVEPRVAYGWQSNWDGETHGTHWTFAHA